MNIKTIQTDNVLCVPIFTQALLVGSPTSKAKFSNINDNFALIENNPLGDKVQGDIFATSDTISAGIHLNWLLPHSLRKGIQKNQNEEPVYPKVPNRWVVTRLWSSLHADTAVNMKQWIVESNVLLEECDKESHNQQSLTFPYKEDPLTPYRFLGRSYAVGTAVEKANEYVEDLTALGYGDPLFPVMYPYHRNVFGFYDNLVLDDGTKLENASINYVVRGYYADQNLLLDSVDECIDRFGWLAPKDAVFPATIVLHGLLESIKWINFDTDYSESTYNKLTQPKIAVGNTSAEALAAISNQSIPNSEDLFTILLHNQIYDWTQINGVLNSEYKKHELRFEKSIEQKRYELKGLLAVSDQKDLSQNEQHLFRALQHHHNELKQLFFKLEDIRKNLYINWNKYMLTILNKVIIKPVDREKLIERYRLDIEASFSDIDAIIESFHHVEQVWKQTETELKDKLSDQYEIFQTVSDHYYEPNEPVVLLKNVSKGAQFKTLQTFQDEDRLKTRVLSDVLTAIDFRIKYKDIDYTFPIDLSSIIPSIDKNTLYLDILLEALLFSSLSIHAITQFVIAELNLSDISPTVYQSIKDQVTAFHLTIRQSCTENELNYPAPTTFTSYEYPWNPLVLACEVAFYPDEHLLDEYPSLDNWKLSYIDYEYIGEMYTSSNKAIITSKIITTPLITDHLQFMIKTQLGDDTLDHLGEINDLNIISQSINSFNEIFLMNELSIRFPPFVINEGDPRLAEKVAKQLDHFHYRRPLFNEFYSPIRAGFMRLDELRLIDTYGQCFDIDINKVAIAENMYCKKFAEANLIMMPPRFIQPTKLDINWLDAITGEHCNFNLSDSPVCGWIIPNYLDQSLLIYDKNGEMLGSLVVTGFEDEKIQWRNRPGSSEHSQKYFGVHAEALPAEMDKEMKKFIQEILRRNIESKEDVLTPLLKIMDKANGYEHPYEAVESSGLSLFIGQPLVLTRAHIALQQAGDMSAYISIDHNIKKPNPIKPSPVKHFNMPLIIGENSHLNDGTVGFFINNEKDTYSTLHICVEEDNLTSDYFNSNNQVLLQVEEVSEGCTISILSNPLSSVHFISGMLPIYDVSLPQQLVEKQLNKLYLTFFAGPLLIGVENFVTPISIIENRTWSYIHSNEKQEWVETNNIEPANGNAFLAKYPISIVEGWFKINLNEEKRDE